MTDCELNALAAEIHAANSRWWHDLETGERLDRNKGEMLMLVVSELAECLEGERKNIPDEHLPHRQMAEVELADVLIRVFDFAGGFNYRLKEATVTFRTDNRAEYLLRIVDQVLSAYKAIISRDYGSTPEFELSGVIGAVYAYAAKFGYDVGGAMAEKRAYNATRHDHSREARLAANGKKF